ncbi:hypothetical protein LINPERPRIM_LOCUS10318 [Linum perenne]
MCSGGQRLCCGFGSKYLYMWVLGVKRHTVCSCRCLCILLKEGHILLGR